MKVLIDTCVVVDFLQQRQPFAESALKVFMLAGSGEINGYITAKSVTDIYYLIHRITHSDSVTRETLEKLFSIVEILDTTANDICLALSSTISDYEDAVMIETGIILHMSEIAHTPITCNRIIQPQISPAKYVSNLRVIDFNITFRCGCFIISSMFICSYKSQTFLNIIESIRYRSCFAVLLRCKPGSTFCYVTS